MSRVKFKVGDRVRVTQNQLHSDKGQIGTVLEESVRPWIEFDTPTRYPYTPSDFPNVRPGFADWIFQGELEPLKEREPTNTFSFYTVWDPQGRAPQMRHRTREKAEAEARRLACQTPCASFYVMEAVSVSRKADVVTQPCQTNPEEVQW